MIMECKKCKRPLPEGSKEKLCENCRGKRAQGIKDVGKAVLAVCGTVLSLALVVVTKGKIDPKGK
ncbi:MAG: hypothetical protein APF81_25710 [Desulfosporosinus sp. BRH_c37]|nr:MAG: hypothetical protein APF81_25710 [Desulfosporosinus sp. BRH_c37]